MSLNSKSLQRIASVMQVLRVNIIVIGFCFYKCCGFLYQHKQKKVLIILCKILRFRF